MNNKDLIEEKKLIKFLGDVFGIDLESIIEEQEQEQEQKKEVKEQEYKKEVKEEPKKSVIEQTEKLINDFMEENKFYTSNKYNTLFNKTIKSVLYDFCMWAYNK